MFDNIKDFLINWLGMTFLIFCLTFVALVILVFCLVLFFPDISRLREVTILCLQAFAGVSAVIALLIVWSNKSDERKRQLSKIV